MTQQQVMNRQAEPGGAHHRPAPGRQLAGARFADKVIVQTPTTQPGNRFRSLFASWGTGLIPRLVRPAWQWWRALPLTVKLITWLLLAVVFAGTDIVVMLVPVMIGLWVWDAIAPHARQRFGHRTHPSLASAATRTDLRQWACHLAQMVIAMYAGMAVYMQFAPALMGPGDLRYAGMVVSMLVPMVALMRLQHHSWRMTNEMAISMAAPMVICVALVRLGLCPLIPFLTWLTAANVYAVAHQAMLLGMIAVMIYRHRMYAAAHNPAPRKQQPATTA
jgi:hypothetical protein